MTDLTYRQRVALDASIQAHAAPTTTEDRLIEFAARIVAMYVMAEATKGEAARQVAMSAVRGHANLAGLNTEIATKVGDSAADHINAAVEAVRAVGSGDAASMLLLMKQAKAGGK